MDYQFNSKDNIQVNKISNEYIKSLDYIRLVNLLLLQINTQQRAFILNRLTAMNNQLVKNRNFTNEHFDSESEIDIDEIIGEMKSEKSNDLNFKLDRFNHLYSKIKDHRKQRKT
uniref:Uncharacterized protein n=1 Tax=viral metagenome TaxID=1070528 RepID=A0A6C0LQZ0_9ZZZZ